MLFWQFADLSNFDHSLPKGPILSSKRPWTLRKLTSTDFVVFLAMGWSKSTMFWSNLGVLRTSRSGQGVFLRRWYSFVFERTQSRLVLKFIFRGGNVVVPPTHLVKYLSQKACWPSFNFQECLLEFASGSKRPEWAACNTDGVSSDHSPSSLEPLYSLLSESDWLSDTSEACILRFLLGCIATERELFSTLIDWLWAWPRAWPLSLSSWLSKKFNIMLYRIYTHWHCGTVLNSLALIN